MKFGTNSERLLEKDLTVSLYTLRKILKIK